MHFAARVENFPPSTGTNVNIGIESSASASMRVEHLAEREQIAPGKALLRGLPQQVGRVKRGQQRNVPPTDIRRHPLAAQLQDAVAAARSGGGPGWRRGTRSRRASAARWCGSRKGRHICVSASVGVRLPGGRQKITLVMNTALSRSSRLARQADRGQHPVQELARRADEGLALDVLVAARRLAHQHDARSGVAVGKAQPGRRLLERAGVEGLQCGGDLRQAVAGWPAGDAAAAGWAGGRRDVCRRRVAAAAGLWRGAGAARRFTGASPMISSAPISASQRRASAASCGVMSFCSVSMSEMVACAGFPGHYKDARRLKIDGVRTRGTGPARGDGI